ncbi:histidine phosphatase superfamily [Phaeosphaeria sp. MPI-PUGE-AT-0046c]|nr:histidine phosphatase superfamily [Phaeosphaeria sp. MPI-PUGE-AT-0046c]
MRPIYNILVIIVAVILAIYYGNQTTFLRKSRPKNPPGPIMPNGDWRFTAQRGYFSHDNDPASWDFRAKTLPNLGLVEKLYGLGDSDKKLTPDEIARTQWSRFLDYADFMNTIEPGKKSYKVFYIVRHGQGVHNVKETEVGREEWNRHWAKLPGDSNSTWLDASLTPTGEQQAKEIASLWSEAGNIPPPQSIYSSPLRRCLQTTTFGFAPLLHQTTPIIKENLRERLGVHTCDQRSSRSWIAESYPNFKIEANFTENDELWKADQRETIDEHIVRSQKVLQDIFENDGSQVVALVGHSGTSMALFGATGWGKIPMAAGAVYPLLVCGERVGDGDEEDEEGDGGEK